MRATLVGVFALFSWSAFAQCDFMVDPVNAGLYTATALDYANGFSTLYRGPYTRGPTFFEGAGSHPGVDITHDVQRNRLTTNSPVRAICAGEVVRVTTDGPYDGGWGNSITVRHTVPGIGDVFSAYAHLDRFARPLSVGPPNNSVTGGELLGYVGTTGASTGCRASRQVGQNA